MDVCAIYLYVRRNANNNASKPFSGHLQCKSDVVVVVFVIVTAVLIKRRDTRLDRIAPNEPAELEYTRETRSSPLVLFDAKRGRVCFALQNFGAVKVAVSAATILNVTTYLCSALYILIHHSRCQDASTEHYNRLSIKLV